MNQRLWVTTEGRGTDSGRPMMEEPAGEEQMVGFPFKGIHLRRGHQVWVKAPQSASGPPWCPHAIPAFGG